MRYCRVCGKQFVSDEKFCTGCGIAASVDPKERRNDLNKDFIKGMVCSLLVCILIFGLIVWLVVRNKGKDESQQPSNSQSAQQAEGPAEGAVAVPGGGKFEGEGFASAQDAIEAYLAAFSRGDVSGMTATFAVETFVTHFDVQAMLSRNGVYSSGMPQLLRGDDPYTQAVNVGRRYASINTEFSEAYFTLTGHGDYLAAATRVEAGKEAAFMDAIMEEDWMEMLSGMTVNGIYLDGEMKQVEEKLDPAGEQLSKAVTDYMKMYGCEAYSMAIVDLTIGGRDYLLSLDVACYDGTWYICQQTGLAGLILGMDGIGGGFALKE